MSEENRDMTTGQFSPAEPLYGKEGIEKDAGYVPYEDDAAVLESELPPLTVEEAADKLTASRAPESAIKTYSPLGDLPENVTLTIEEAAKIRSDMKAADEAGAEDAKAEALRKEVDELRGVVKETQAKEVKAETTPEADVDRLLAIPHVKEAFDKRANETETARQTYTQAVGVAQQFAQAAFVENFPEIAALPLDQWEAALGAMQQREPARFNKALGTIQRVVQLQSLAEEQQQIKTQAEQREVQTFAKAENARFEQMIKGESKQHVKAVEGAIFEAIKEYGGDTAEFLNLMKSTKLLNSAIAQRLLYDAGQYRLIAKAPKAVATKTVPQVQRPGVSSGRSPSGNGETITRLQSQMSKATGDKQLRLAGQLLAAKRAARGG